MNLRERASLVDALGSALSRGNNALGNAPGLLRRLLEEGAWRDFETQMHTQIHYDRFEQFVTTPPLNGLGASIELIRRMVADDPVTLDLLDQALQNPVGRPELTTSITGSSSPNTGTQQEALRRLRSQRPDLHTQVLAKELSPHAAMVLAGFRHPTVTIPTDDTERIARTLQKHLSPEDLQKLVDHLMAQMIKAARA